MAVVDSVVPVLAPGEAADVVTRRARRRPEGAVRWLVPERPARVQVLERSLVLALAPVSAGPLLPLPVQDAADAATALQGRRFRRRMPRR